MTSSPAFQTLCCELVEDYYGDFYRSIFECLVTGGRLAAPQVAQKCHLPLRQARSGLSGLIQLRLVNNHTPRDAPTLYSVNLVNAHDIIRSGRLVEAARQFRGETAAAIVSTACDLGFATISELRDRTLLSHEVGDENATTIEQLIEDLLEDHYLMHLRKAHLSEAHDVRREVELSLLSPTAIAKLTGTKAKMDHQSNVDRGYDGTINTSNYENGYSNDNFTSKQKEKNGITNGVLTNGHAAPRTTLIQPNFHKIVLLSQSAVATDLAQKTNGKSAATILTCVLRQTADPDIWSKLHPAHEHNIDMHRLRKDVNTDRRIEAQASAPHTNGTVNGHSHDSVDDDLAIGDLDRELMFLTESAFPFLSGSPNAWSLSKGMFDDWIRKEETLRVMDSRLDPPAPRILRILIDKGKLEERTLQEIGLLGAKELRQSLSILKQMGYLDLQEVPRNPTRQPNQTVFLWGFEEDRVRQLVIENIFKGMLRLLQLLRTEREKIGGTLRKIEREDVRGREKEMLPGGEYLVLERFWRLESWVWGELGRLDSTVAVLRDT